MAEQSGWRPTPLGLLTIALAALQAAVTAVVLTSRQLNADDVWIHLWWERWRPFSNEISLSRNTWVLHAPVASLTELVVGRGVAALVAAAVILNLAGLLLVVRFVWFLAGRLGAGPRRRLAAVGVAGLWLILLSPLFVAFTARVNFRNVEIGIALFVIQAIVTSAEAPVRPRRVVALALVIGVLCFNDPWFLYAGVVPGVVVLGARWLFASSTRTEIAVLGRLVLGGLAAIVVRWVFGAAGVTISDYAAPAVVDFGSIPTRLFRQVDLLLALFGADLGGRDLHAASTLLHLFRAAVLIAVLIAAWHLRHRIPGPARLPLAGLALIAVSGFAATVASGFGPADATNVRFARYLVPVAGMMVIGVVVPVVVGGRRVRRAVTALTLGAVATVAVSVAGDAVDRVRDGVDAHLLDEVHELTDHLEADGYTRGYTDFMGGMAVDYWSGGDIDVALVDCGPDGLANSLLSPVDDYRAPDGPTFVLHLARSGLVGCDDELLRSTLGTPTGSMATEHFSVTTYDGVAER